MGLEIGADRAAQPQWLQQGQTARCALRSGFGEHGVERPFGPDAQRQQGRRLGQVGAAGEVVGADVAVSGGAYAGRPVGQDDDAVEVEASEDDPMVLHLGHHPHDGAGLLVGEPVAEVAQRHPSTRVSASAEDDPPMSVTATG